MIYSTMSSTDGSTEALGLLIKIDPGQVAASQVLKLGLLVKIDLAAAS